MSKFKIACIAIAAATIAVSPAVFFHQPSPDSPFPWSSSFAHETADQVTIVENYGDFESAEWGWIDHEVNLETFKVVEVGGGGVRVDRMDPATLDHTCVAPNDENGYSRYECDDPVMVYPDGVERDMFEAIEWRKVRETSGFTYEMQERVLAGGEI